MVWQRKCHGFSSALFRSEVKDQESGSLGFTSYQPHLSFHANTNKHQEHLFTIQSLNSDRQNGSDWQLRGPSKADSISHNARVNSLCSNSWNLLLHNMFICTADVCGWVDGCGCSALLRLLLFGNYKLCPHCSVPSPSQLSKHQKEKIVASYWAPWLSG